MSIKTRFRWSQPTWAGHFTLAAIIATGLLRANAGIDTNASVVDASVQFGQGPAAEFYLEATNVWYGTNPLSAAVATSAATNAFRHRARPVASHVRIGDTNLFSRLTNQYDPEIVKGIFNGLPKELQEQLGRKEDPQVVSNKMKAMKLLLGGLGFPTNNLEGPDDSVAEKRALGRVGGTNSAEYANLLADASTNGEARSAGSPIMMKGQHEPTPMPSWPLSAEQRAAREKARDLAAFVQPLQSILALAGVSAILVMYFYVSWCCRQLCWRTGVPTQVLVWLPLVKRFPLFSATGTSRMWFWLGLVIPFVGLAGWALCCWRLCATFGKSRWLTVAMALPWFGWIGFIYLEAATRAEDEEMSVKRLKAGYAF